MASSSSAHQRPTRARHRRGSSSPGYGHDRHQERAFPGGTLDTAGSVMFRKPAPKWDGEVSVGGVLACCPPSRVSSQVLVGGHEPQSYIRAVAQHLGAEQCWSAAISGTRFGRLGVSATRIPDQD